MVMALSTPINDTNKQNTNPVEVNSLVNVPNLQTKFTKKTPNEVVSYKIIPLFLSFNQKTKVIKDSKKAEYGQCSYATEN